MKVLCKHWSVINHKCANLLQFSKTKQNTTLICRALQALIKLLPFRNCVPILCLCAELHRGFLRFTMSGLASKILIYWLRVGYPCIWNFWKLPTCLYVQPGRQSKYLTGPIEAVFAALVQYILMCLCPLQWLYSGAGHFSCALPQSPPDLPLTPFAILHKASKGIFYNIKVVLSLLC